MKEGNELAGVGCDEHAPAHRQLHALRSALHAPAHNHVQVSQSPFPVVSFLSEIKKFQTRSSLDLITVTFVQSLSLES
jgi:hypothetical protein